MKPLSLHLPEVEPGEALEVMPGVRVWRNPSNEFLVVRTHYTADPNRRGDWKYKASPKYGGLNSWRWRKEQEIDWKAMAGRLVWENWDESVHMIEPFVPPMHWPRWVLIDPGWTNPTSVLWVAVDVDADHDLYGYLPVHVYRELYESRRSTHDIALLVEGSSWHWTSDGRRLREQIEEVIIDPSAKQEHQSAASPENVDESAATVFDQLRERLEESGFVVPVKTGNNHKQEAIVEILQRLGNYWCDAEGLPLYDENNNWRTATEEELLAGAYMIPPTLFLHGGCRETAQEFARYRWKDWHSSEVRERRNDPESPIDKDDHSITNLIRFMNEMRKLRGGDPEDDEVLFDLSAWESRFDRSEPKSAEEIQQERHQKAASRFRKKRMRGRRSPSQNP